MTGLRPSLARWAAAGLYRSGLIRRLGWPRKTLSPAEIWNASGPIWSTGWTMSGVSAGICLGGKTEANREQLDKSRKL